MPGVKPLVTLRASDIVRDAFERMREMDAVTARAMFIPADMLQRRLDRPRGPEYIRVPTIPDLGLLAPCVGPYVESEYCEIKYELIRNPEWVRYEEMLRPPWEPQCPAPADPWREDVRRLAIGYEIGFQLPWPEAEHRARYKVALLDLRDRHGLEAADMEGYDGWRKSPCPRRRRRL